MMNSTSDIMHVNKKLHTRATIHFIMIVKQLRKTKYGNIISNFKQKTWFKQPIMKCYIIKNNINVQLRVSKI